jgi:FMN reductase
MRTTPARSLVVVSAGLAQPSSTRLLADRLSAAVDRHLRDAGIEPQLEVIELREHAQDLTNNLLTGFRVRDFRRRSTLSSRRMG